MARAKRKQAPAVAHRDLAVVRSGFTPPRTVSHRALLDGGSDVAFRETLYLMVLVFGRLQVCREAFGRALRLTGSQFAVLIGTAYRQGADGVSIRALAEHIQLAPTHVTTEVGRLIRKGLLVKKVNPRDRRGVLVRLSARGEAEVVRVTPFVRKVNDLLFKGISRQEFGALARFLEAFAANSERALTHAIPQGASPHKPATRRFMLQK